MNKHKYSIKTARIESFGNDLDDLLANAYIKTGDYENPEFSLEDFDDHVQAAFRQEIIEEMAAQDEDRNEKAK